MPGNGVLAEWKRDVATTTQAEQLVNCIVVTGQESVEGSSRRMREDLYKKHMSGDPVAARLPYAIITKQVDPTHRADTMPAPTLFRGTLSFPPARRLEPPLPRPPPPRWNNRAREVGKTH